MSEASKAWSWRHAFSTSALPATTKHVLHTLGMFMNELGEGCYPSVADICRYSGLDKKTVLKHLAVARDAGWIAVSQHGYRGQKWKRQEYAARWPGRDLVAPCPADDREEGGGAAPPPLEAEKVVESTPQGGGTEGSKVVEEVHQDKTSPVTTPDTSPVERERGREGNSSVFTPEAPDGTGNDARSAVAASVSPADDPKAVETAFWRVVKDWPGFAGMPKEPARRVWMTLSADERRLAEERLPGWLALLKAQKKSHTPAPSTYFGEKLWSAVRDPAEEKPAALFAAAFGPLWMAARLKALLAGCPPLPPPRGGFLASLLAQDDAAGRLARLERQAKLGWPNVNAMHDRAANGQGVGVAPELEPVAPLMEPVPVGSEQFAAWRAEHEKRGWPWLPDPGRMPVVYFPAGGPGRLGEFEAAVRRQSGPPPATSEASEPKGGATNAVRGEHVHEQAAE